MERDTLEKALVAAAMTLAEERGWGSVSVVESARRANLSLIDVRQYFPSQTSILLCLGRLADKNALCEDFSHQVLSDDDIPTDSTSTEGDDRRERLFDMLMCRLDVFQQYRKGVKSVLRSLPFNPWQAVQVGNATAESMRWIAEAAGLDVHGFAGMARVGALVGLWTHVIRVWEQDENVDMGNTMAALEQALDQGVKWGLLSSGGLLRAVMS